MGKICSKCKIEKETTEFYKHPKAKDGLFTACKKCRYLYYEKNSKRKKEYQKNYSLKAEVRYKKYKEHAKVRNLIFDLTFQQFMQFWQKTCCYCGDKIKTIGLDRVDNEKGYNINNIISCCGVCNSMKNKLLDDTFKKQCKKIVDYQMNLK